MRISPHQKFSFHAHRSHALMNPIGAQKVEWLLDVMAPDLPPRPRVWDIGCGKAEVLIRCVERFDAHALGIDQNPLFVAEARERAAARIPDADFEVLQGAGATLREGPHADLAIAMGCRPFGETCLSSLEGLAARVKPGGFVLMGEGIWTKPPSAALLAFLEADINDSLTHGATLALGPTAGLTPIYSCVANPDEWDHYEGRYLANMERYCLEHAQDPDVPTMRERIRAWHDAYQRLLRGALGFGLYLYRR